MVRLTDPTHFGVLADLTRYRMKSPGDAGSQWRGMALLQWARRFGWMPERCAVFGQLGVGYGQVDYADSVQYRLSGPASRLALGLEMEVIGGGVLTIDVSMDRLDAAVGPWFSRRYPTMVALNVGVALLAPRGRALLWPTRRSTHALRPQAGQWLRRQR